MAVTLNVHLSYEYNPQVIDYLIANLEPGIRLTTGEAMSRSGDINILVAGRPDRDLLEVNKDLQALIVPWTGIPPQTRDLLADFPHITIYNLHHSTPVRLVDSKCFCKNTLAGGAWESYCPSFPLDCS